MTDAHRESVEFESLIEASGTIVIPPYVVEEFGRVGRTVHVRLTAHTISAGLKERDVDEEEIERIAAIQLESRGQVVKFLLSEGALQKKTPRRTRDRH